MDTLSQLSTHACDIADEGCSRNNTLLPALRYRTLQFHRGTSTVPPPRQYSLPTKVYSWLKINKSCIFRVHVYYECHCGSARTRQSAQAGGQPCRQQGAVWARTAIPFARARCNIRVPMKHPVLAWIFRPDPPFLLCDVNQVSVFSSLSVLRQPDLP